jgi:methyltransferase-like protein
MEMCLRELRWLSRAGAGTRQGRADVGCMGSTSLRSKTLKTAPNPHDQVAYPGVPNRDSHPSNMAAMAILHGLRPAPPDRCRVLEIACNEGANLIPMAYAIPTSEFVGFDLAQLPIERGQARARELGLHNLRLFAGDLLDVGPELGQFDYILAHGLYGWVPEPVRDRLLALCSEMLTEQGVAFVSYNAKPGGYLRLMARDMMQFRTTNIADPEKRVAEGLSFLRYLVSVREENDLFRAVIEDQLTRMEKRPAAVTVHDEMTEAYHPVHFLEFVEHARKHGLEFLSEAALPPPPDPTYSGETRAALEKAVGGDFLLQEQLLDFLRMRMYRETLLCREGKGVRRDFPVESFRRLLLASQTTAAAGEAPGATAFVLPGGIKLESNHPGVKTLLGELGKAWPRALSFEELEPHLAGTGLALDAQGVALIFRLAVAKMIEFRGWNPPLARSIPERPKASQVSRQEAQTRSTATSLLHLSVSLEDPKLRCLIKLLDGTRTRDELLKAMAAEMPETQVSDLKEGLERALRNFFSAGILEA